MTDKRNSVCDHLAHFLCLYRAIMEHKELLKVPWDWQIGRDLLI